MRDQPSPNNFTNQGGQIWCNITHFGNQIIIKPLPVLREVHHSLGKHLNINQVDCRQVLSCKRGKKMNTRFDKFACNIKMSILPIDAFPASTISLALSSSPSMSVKAGIMSSDNFDLSSISFTTRA